jgi:hypothetical protein
MHFDEPAALDPPLRVESVDRDGGDSLPFRTIGDGGDRPSTAVPPPEPATHTPPLVVLALTLGLGLAVGAAGGYLVGHRSGERAAQRALGGETGTTSATFDPASAPPPAAVPDAATPPTASRGEAPPPSSTAPATGAPSAPSASGQAEPRRETPAASRGRAAVAAATTGQLAIRSTPARAGVLIDGIWRGRTPITVRGLGLGTHAVRVVEDGYVAESRRVAVDARAAGTTVSFQLARVRGPDRPVPVRPGATTGALRVESRPSGAAVLIDGRVIGTTPLLISDLEPGAHQVRLELPGHRPWATATSIVAGQSVRVAASLEEN